MKFWNKFRPHVAEDLTAFCDGVLPAEESRRVGEHLRTCKSCQRDYEEIRFAMGLLASELTRVPAPSGVWDAIQDRWQERRREAHSPGPRVLPLSNLRTGAAFAGALAVITLAVFVVLRFGSPPRWTRPVQSPLQFNLGDYINLVRTAPGEASLRAIYAAPRHFADRERREVFQVAGLAPVGSTPLPGYEMLAHRVSLVGETELAQLVYAKDQDAFSVFVAPRPVNFLLGEYSVSGTEIRGVRCQKVNCPFQASYVFGEGDFSCALVSKSLDADKTAAIMQYFILAHKQARHAR